MCYYLKKILFSNSSSSSNNEINPLFASYLAGLIEGDGTIVVPKIERSPTSPLRQACGERGKFNYPSIQIVFDLRDLPLALILQSKINCGSISRKKVLMLIF